MSFGETITNLRKAKGITQEQLAEKLGVTRQTISKWELDQSTPDLDYIIRLSDLFEVSTDYLIKGEDSQKENQADKQAEMVKEVVYVDNMEKTIDAFWNPIVIVGIIVALLGGTLTIISLVGQFSEETRILCGIIGIIVFIIGVEMILVKKHPVLTVLWTFWLFGMFTLGVMELSYAATREFNGEYIDVSADSATAYAINPMGIFLIYTLVLIIATIRCIRKSKKVNM